jgi:hypothetical protein
MNSKPSFFRSITRLAIGGLLIAIEELNTRIPEWENAAKERARREGDDSISVQATSSDLDNVRDGAIGFVFDVQDRIGLSFRRLEWIAQKISDRSTPFFRPFSQSRINTRISSQIDQLAVRGQNKIDHWILVGRHETAHSKALLLTAVEDSVDQTVNEVSTRPEVMELVSGQGVTMTEAIVEEIRERTVSTDNLLDTITRRILRRPPISMMPEPSLEVKKQTEPVRKIGGRIVKK